MSLKVLTDSSSDLPLDFVEKNSHILEFIGMPIQLEDKEYLDDLGKTFHHDFFYEKLKGGIFPKTSQINIVTFLEYFRKYNENGDIIIYIGLSSGLSGTMNNAILAKEMLLEEDPKAEIHIIDTVAASGGLGALVAHTVSLINEGKEKDEVLSWIRENVLKTNHWFAIDDLTHLKKGGRIPPPLALVGTALKVKPILTIAQDGRIKAFASVRGRHKSIKYLRDKYLENIGQVKDKNVFICHAHCLEDALKLQELILSAGQPKEIFITELSATIGTHVGIGMLAVAFIGDKVREDKT